MILRPYQEKALADLRSALARYQRVLLVMPTGSGKGTLATYIIHAANAKGNRVIFLVNRRTLVHDMVLRLQRLGLAPGVVMGASTRGMQLPVLVASIDTLHRREIPDAKVVFVDEAHFSCSPTWKSVLNRYSFAKIIGMTATPIRADGRGLGENFQHIVLGPSVQELVVQGDLVPARTYAPSVPDLAGVHTTAGDYQNDELAAVMDKPKLVGNIVQHWQKLAVGRPTVVFAVNCAHGEHVTKEFCDVGISARFMDATTTDHDRDRCWADLSDGRLPVVVSVGIISYGWDVPAVSCCVLARPTKSAGLHLQQIGRTLRPAPNKTESLVLDHAGNTLRHGFCDDEREWTLKGKTKKDKQALPPERLPKVCPECTLVWLAGTRECSCGYKFAVSIPYSHIFGELQEMPRYSVEQYAKYTKGTASTDPAFEMLVLRAKRMNYKPGWLFHMLAALEFQRERYRQAFGEDAPLYWHAGGLARMIDAKRTG